MPDFILVISGTTGVAGQASPSSATALNRPIPYAIYVPSLSPTSEVRLQFAQTSGGSGVGDSFSDLQRLDGTGLPHTVYSGAGPAFAPLMYLPTPWVRISLVASQTSVRTFGVYQMAQYRP
jgi:hypothetical protein